LLQRIGQRPSQQRSQGGCSHSWCVLDGMRREALTDQWGRCRGRWGELEK
ncbi:hypothetical protein KI387_016634, partial [Taxus chinensis]